MCYNDVTARNSDNANQDKREIFTMATDFGNYQYLVENFNEKFKVNFSYEAFESDIRSYDIISENFTNLGSDVRSGRYVKAFADLYRQALTNYADRKIHFFSGEEFLNEFEKMMKGYTEATLTSGTGPKKSWPSSSRLIDRVKADLNDPKKGIPDTKLDYIIKRYNDRTLPMSKMREEAKKLIDSNSKDPTKYSTILGYSKALEEINSQRPRWWRIIHPFRNNAEQREAKAFKKIVTEKLGLYKDKKDVVQESNVIGATKSSNVLTDDFVIARAILNDTSLADAKNELQVLSEKLKVEATKATEKTGIVVNEVSEQTDKTLVSPPVDKVKSTDLSKKNEEIKQEEIKQQKL